jgi:calcium-dependent protein kinase
MGKTSHPTSPKNPKPDAYKRRGTISAIAVQINAGMFISEKKGKVTNDYDVICVIGKGGYGEVWKVIHKVTGDTRAMKIIKKESCDESYLKSLGKEINIMRQLDHPHIIKLYEIYQDTSSIYMITEFLGGGELFDVLATKRFLNESTAAKLIK